MRVVVAGAGALGGRLAARLHAAGHWVLGLRRQPPAASFEQRAVDLTALRPGQLADLAADTLVYCATPERADADAYRAIFQHGVAATIAALGPTLQRALLVSSTAVYADADGDWVDETTPARPSRWNGVELLAAERAFAAHAQLDRTLIITRLSGLYGPGRQRLLRRAAAGEAGALRWSNRVHLDDAAAALDHLLQLPQPPALVCVSDPHPVSEVELLAELRRLQGLASLPAAAAACGPLGGRRIGCQRLLASGFQFRFPDFRLGYAELLQTGQELGV